MVGRTRRARRKAAGHLPFEGASPTTGRAIFSTRRSRSALPGRRLISRRRGPAIRRCITWWLRPAHGETSRLPTRGSRTGCLPGFRNHRPRHGRQRGVTRREGCTLRSDRHPARLGADTGLPFMALDRTRFPAPMPRRSQPGGGCPARGCASEGRRWRTSRPRLALS